MTKFSVCECRALAKRLALAEKSRETLTEGVKLANQNISHLQDELTTTKRSYEDQLSMMSDHLCSLNETLSKQREEIDTLKLGSKKGFLSREEAAAWLKAEGEEEKDGALFQWLREDKPAGAALLITLRGGGEDTLAGGGREADKTFAAHRSGSGVLELQSSPWRVLSRRRRYFAFVAAGWTLPFAGLIGRRDTGRRERFRSRSPSAILCKSWQLSNGNSGLRAVSAMRRLMEASRQVRAQGLLPPAHTHADEGSVIAFGLCPLLACKKAVASNVVWCLNSSAPVRLGRQRWNQVSTHQPGSRRALRDVHHSPPPGERAPGKRNMTETHCRHVFHEPPRLGDV
ncbi:hypothetical protein AAFF_G00115790 [Aldrovandia affinis]|uniref:Protein phosphatase 1 regulatory subunit 21 C-terminal domain-containing protein n=1 Tax=Aldrovandia affinis TaxID=143900 RepID=A0AAD7T1F8_9TELE|nr:hypothetical protein AAFF_G00115790 [Aldrovandia affinis]